mmetsp:Transcript_21796/g.57772  ORF Transcript_21796/g.57772 Transcript_21796/m.57772 type:complete len:105 (-) Transcript_21796:786-1100(-)
MSILGKETAATPVRYWMLNVLSWATHVWLGCRRRNMTPEQSAIAKSVQHYTNIEPGVARIMKFCSGVQSNPDHDMHYYFFAHRVFNPFPPRWVMTRRNGNQSPW